MSAQIIAALRQRADVLDGEAAGERQVSLSPWGSGMLPGAVKHLLADEFRALADAVEGTGQQAGLDWE